jgi:hypothetical protein
MRTCFGKLATVLAFAGQAAAYSAYAGCIIPSAIPTGFVGTSFVGFGFVDPTGVDCAVSSRSYLLF